MSNLCNETADLFRKNATLFTALGDTHRQNLLLVMSDGKPKCVKEIAEHIQLSRPAVSHHIKILKEAKLLKEYREGRRTYYIPSYHSHITPLKALLESLEKL